MSHPLTDEFLGRQCQWLFDEQDMRLAYDMGAQAGRDEMLKEVIQWFDENEDNYFDHHTIGRIRLMADLKEAMSPTAQEES